LVSLGIWVHIEILLGGWSKSACVSKRKQNGCLISAQHTIPSGALATSYFRTLHYSLNLTGFWAVFFGLVVSSLRSTRDVSVSNFAPETGNLDRNISYLITDLPRPLPSRSFQFFGHMVITSST
jgi:hypothetical protein